MKQHLYAIGFKDWVELRRSKSPPKAETSKVDQEVTSKVLTGFDYPGPGSHLVPVYRDDKKVIPLTAVIHKGGRVVKVMKKRTFSIMTGLHVPPGKVIKVSETLARRVMSRTTYTITPHFGD